MKITLEMCSLETNLHYVLLSCARNDCYKAVCFSAKLYLLKLEELYVEISKHIV